MLIVLAISIAIMVLRFGLGFLEDNFVAQLSTHYRNSAEFLSFYGLLNFYLYTMAYVYSPSKNALYGKDHLAKILGSVHKGRPHERGRVDPTAGLARWSRGRMLGS